MKKAKPVKAWFVGYDPKVFKTPQAVKFSYLEAKELANERHWNIVRVIFTPFYKSKRKDKKGLILLVPN